MTKRTKTMKEPKDIFKLISEISDDVSFFEKKYNTKPTVIIISRELEAILSYVFELNSYSIYRNGKIIYNFFGIDTIASDKLHDNNYTLY